MNEEIEAKYVLDERTTKMLENNFSYHAPKGDQAGRYGTVRDAFKALAYTISKQCPPSRELSVALTNLETACFWANASIARGE